MCVCVCVVEVPPPPPPLQALQRAALSCVDSLELRSYEFSSFSGHLGGSKEFKEDLIRCHALLVRSEFTIRVNTLPSFMEANRMVGAAFQCNTLLLTTPTPQISQHLSAFGLDKPPNQPNWRSKVSPYEDLLMEWFPSLCIYRV